ncbi:UrcA family protein [Novosphingobium sp.]|uniref:UrcA family protein n=1 Tax=Novosphingobium sp. TaxID=1874826 RepID=UPI0035B070E3
MRKILMTTIALATLAAAPVAYAQSEMTQTAAVRYADLDLSSKAGKLELERRISGAERQLCKSEREVGSHFSNRHEVATCKAQVRAQVNTAIYG